jgi:hypothetical protein
MEQMNITSAQYYAEHGTNVSITATINGKVLYVPIAQGNRHYAEILRQVEAGTLTIQEADDGSE